MKQAFFSTLQLTCNIVKFRKFHFKILKNHRDIAFFLDPFKFELYENLKRTDVRNLRFILSVHLFTLFTHLASRKIAEQTAISRP